MRHPELFENADFGKPRPSLARARELVAEVERLLEPDEDDWVPDFVNQATRIAEKACTIGAYSVERVLRWSVHPKALDRHGFERTATRWLARLERAR